MDEGYSLAGAPENFPRHNHVRPPLGIRPGHSVALDNSSLGIRNIVGADAFFRENRAQPVSELGRKIDPVGNCGSLSDIADFAIS